MADFRYNNFEKALTGDGGYVRLGLYGGLQASM